jgi:hypothetical protein
LSYRRSEDLITISQSPIGRLSSLQKDHRVLLNSIIILVIQKIQHTGAPSEQNKILLKTYGMILEEVAKYEPDALIQMHLEENLKYAHCFGILIRIYNA